MARQKKKQNSTQQQQGEVKKYKLSKNQGYIEIQTRPGEQLAYATITTKEGLIKYQGQINDQQKFHGKGLLMHSATNFYEGEFFNGQKVKGKSVTDEQTYEGEWKDNYPHGKGKIVFKNKEYYDGYFEKGIYQGKGEYLNFKNGMWILAKGQWEKGSRNGIFEIYNLSSLLEQKPKLVMEYDNSFMKKIISFEGCMSNFGYEQKHTKLVNLGSMIKEFYFDSQQQEQKDRKLIKKCIRKAKNNIKSKHHEIKQKIKNKNYLKFEEQYLKTLSSLQNENNKESELDNAWFDQIFDEQQFTPKQQQQEQQFVKLDKEASELIFSKKIHVLTRESQEQIEHNCSICLCEIQQGSLVKQFPCSGKHFFHADCLDNWTKSKTTCPECRFDLTSVPIENIYGEENELFMKIEEEEIEIKDIQIEEEDDDEETEQEDNLNNSEIDEMPELKLNDKQNTEVLYKVANEQTYQQECENNNSNVSFN